MLRGRRLRYVDPLYSPFIVLTIRVGPQRISSTVTISTTPVTSPYASIDILSAYQWVHHSISRLVSTAHIRIGLNFIDIQLGHHSLRMETQPIPAIASTSTSSDIVDIEDSDDSDTDLCELDITLVDDDSFSDSAFIDTKDFIDASSFLPESAIDLDSVSSIVKQSFQIAPPATHITLNPVAPTFTPQALSTPPSAKWLNASAAAFVPSSSRVPDTPALNPLACAFVPSSSEAAEPHLTVQAAPGVELVSLSAHSSGEALTTIVEGEVEDEAELPRKKKTKRGGRNIRPGVRRARKRAREMYDSEADLLMSMYYTMVDEFDE